jgi:hypothetical protein
MIITILASAIKDMLDQIAKILIIVMQSIVVIEDFVFMEKVITHVSAIQDITVRTAKYSTNAVKTPANIKVLATMEHHNTIVSVKTVLLVMNVNLRTHALVKTVIKMVNANVMLVVDIYVSVLENLLEFFVKIFYQQHYLRYPKLQMQCTLPHWTKF